MDKLKKYLIEMGLSEEELIVYMFILQNQGSTILSIARETDIPRTTVYLIVDSLLKQELISEANIDQKKILVPKSPELILKKIEEKKSKLSEAVYEVRELLPELLTTYNLHINKPSVQYIEGEDNIYREINKSLSSNKIYLYCPSGEFNKAFGLMEKFYENLNDNFVYSKEIYLDNSNSNKRLNSKKSIRNQTIALPEIFKSPLDILIYKSNVLTIGYKNNTPYAFLYKSDEAEITEKMKFIMIWQYLTGQK